VAGGVLDESQVASRFPEVGAERVPKCVEVQAAVESTPRLPEGKQVLDGTDRQPTATNGSGTATAPADEQRGINVEWFAALGLPARAAGHARVLAQDRGGRGGREDQGCAWACGPREDRRSALHRDRRDRARAAGVGGGMQQLKAGLGRTIIRMSIVSALEFSRYVS
jgi:hypothetical protein